MSEPSLTAVKTLFAHSRNLCFFGPDGPSGACELTLTDPAWSQVRGQVAHIKGERPGSARYDATQSCGERQGFENLMLLCPNHHAMIDRLRPDDFPVERLRTMRANHLGASSGTSWCSDGQAETFARSALQFMAPTIPRDIDGGSP